MIRYYILNIFDYNRIARHISWLAPALYRYHRHIRNGCLWIRNEMWPTGLQKRNRNISPNDQSKEKTRLPTRPEQISCIIHSSLATCTQNALVLKMQRSLWWWAWNNERTNMSKLWLLIHRPFASSCRRQPWYWRCRIHVPFNEKIEHYMNISFWLAATRLF